MRKYAKALALGLVATQLTGCASTTTVEPNKKPIEHTIEHTSKSSDNTKESKENMADETTSVDVSENNSSVVQSSPSEEPVENLTLDNKDKYSLELYKALYEKDENFAFSPYSITDCFSLVYDGSSGETRKELNDILGFGSRGVDFYRNYDNQAVYYDNKGIKVANKGYINTEYEDKVNKDILGTSDLDTIKMDESAADTMNKFIDDSTEGKITDLISKDAIKDETVMILINALYFRKSWDFEEMTVDWNGETGYKGFGDEIGLLNVKEVTPDIDVLKLRYDEDIDYEKMWEIEGEDKIEEFRKNYDQNRYSMYIICNNVNSKEEKVDEYVNSLTDDSLYDILNFEEYEGLKGYTDANFRIPNFEIKNQISIKEGLRNMGVNAPFESDTTDFEKIGPVYINDILHGAYVKVDYKGTEAAAATAMVMFETCAIEEPHEEIIKEVRADEAFVFIIKDETNDNILFMGRVAEPTEKE